LRKEKESERRIPPLGGRAYDETVSGVLRKSKPEGKGEEIGGGGSGKKSR